MRVNFSIGPYTPTRLHTNTLPHTHARTHTHTHTHTVCARACPGTHRRSLDTAPTYAGRHDALWSVTFHPVKRIIVPSRQPFFCVFLPQQKKKKTKTKKKKTANLNTIGTSVFNYSQKKSWSICAGQPILDLTFWVELLVVVRVLEQGTWFTSGWYSAAIR